MLDAFAEKIYEKRKMLPHVLKVATIFLLASAPMAQADVIPFTSRASFDAAFPGSVRETWEGFAAGTIIPEGTTSGGITYSNEGADALVTNGFLTSTAPNSLGGAPSGGVFEFDERITFEFAVPLSAFGIDINTSLIGDGGYTATLDVGDLVPSFYDPIPGFIFGNFVGFSSTLPFSSVTISGLASGSAYTLDTLRAVDATPPAVSEPASLSLLSLGLLIAALGRRRASLQAASAPARLVPFALERDESHSLPTA